MLSQAILPDVVAYRLPSARAKRASSTSRPYISYVRCSALPLRRT